MSSRSFSVPSELVRLIEQGAITVQALGAMTGINQSTLESILASPQAEAAMDTTHLALTIDEVARLSALTAQLTDGIGIDDDDRLRAILRSLTEELHLSSRHIGRLTGLSPAALQAILSGEQSVTGEEKYRVAIRCSYLINAANLARPR